MPHGRKSALGFEAEQTTISIHVCDESFLIESATRAREPTDIVLTPEQLHRRNLKRRFAETDQPWDSIRLRSPTDIANQVIEAADRPLRQTFDRTDRLRLFEELLEATSGEIDRLHALFGTRLTNNADAIEAARAELELLVGSRLGRLDELRDVCDDLDGFAARDARDYVVGVASLQRELRDSIDGYLSEPALLAEGRDVVEETGGDAWRAAFESIERVHLAGVSTLGTPLLEFLAAVARETEVEVHLYLRAGTGPRLAARLGPRLSLGEAESPPPDDVTGGSTAVDVPACPVTEIVAETRHEEARVAFAVVEGLLQRGISISDIALVARDADAYEHPLDRAAAVYGRHLSVWTQLELKQTIPYRLTVATSRVLADADEAVDVDTVLRPLTLQWVPPDTDVTTDSDIWPLPQAVVDECRHNAETATACSIVEWRERLLAVESLDDAHRDALSEYIGWCNRQPSQPDEDDIVEIFDPLLDAFDRVVLPKRAKNDSPAGDETARTARAFQRVAGDDTDEHLLRETRAKYRSWLDRGHVTKSWETVQEVIDAIASMRPGRREHANADRIDVLDATDTWLRSYPYVVAVGFVDGEWPQQPYGAFPPELRAAIRAGTTPEARRLPVRGAWTTARDRDHFADALRTPTEHLVVTRFTCDTDGVEHTRSPLLDEVSTTVLPADAYQKLVGPDTILPDRIAPAQTANSDGVPTTTDERDEHGAVNRSRPTARNDEQS